MTAAHKLTSVTNEQALRISERSVVHNTQRSITAGLSSWDRRTDGQTNEASFALHLLPGRSTGIKRIKRFYRLRSKERASRKLFLRFYRGACNGRLEKIPKSQPLRHERIIEIYAVCRY